MPYLSGAGARPCCPRVLALTFHPDARSRVAQPSGHHFYLLQFFFTQLQLVQMARSGQQNDVQPEAILRRNGSQS